MKPLALVIILVALAGTAVYWLTRPEPVAVELAPVTRGDVRSTVANTRVGTVEACERAYLSPAAGGQVARLAVQEGDEVTRGSILLEIWNEDRKADLRLAEAEVRAARSRVDEACEVAAGARREEKRLTGLSARQLVSQEDVDRATTEAAARKAACEGAVSAVGVAAARVDVARQALERTILRAPFTGVVAEVEVRLGEYLTPSPPGIATLPAVDLINDACLYVSAPIDEVDAPAIRQGMSACVTLDAFAGRRCGATVRRIAPYVLEREKQARTVEVEVELTDPEDVRGLLPGYSADIEILIEAHENVLRIPTEAVIDKARVLVFDAAAGMLRSREIGIGLSNWDFTEVTDGLAEGEQVVVNVGREGVADGAAAAPAP
jgi:HlyD family secretion protein